MFIRNAGTHAGGRQSGRQAGRQTDRQTPRQAMNFLEPYALTISVTGEGNYRDKLV